ncbi:hypothetical protein VM98_34155, partial [Streptomyces rubellomurinus subsp. indigoferus]
SLLERSDDRLGGPTTPPPLPDWAWKDEPAALLRCHRDPPTLRAPAFACWAVRHASGEHQLLDAFLAASPGEGPRPHTAHPVEGGHITRLFGVFADEDLAGFPPAGDVDIFVPDAGTRLVPALLAHA